MSDLFDAELATLSFIEFAASHQEMGLSGQRVSAQSTEAHECLILIVAPLPPSMLPFIAFLPVTIPLLREHRGQDEGSEKGKEHADHFDDEWMREHVS